jgi:flavodoxin
MRCAIIYWSRYGNGKRCVEHVARRLEERGAEVTVLRTSEADPGAMPQADVYVFSAPAEKLNLQADMRKLMKVLSGMEGKRYALINTHAMKKSRLPKMERLLTGGKGMSLVATVDLQVVKGASERGNALPPGWEGRLDEFAGKLLGP